MRIGGVPCEHEPSQSNPMGSSLACIAPLMPAGKHAVTVHERDVEGFSTTGATCASCWLTYFDSLVVDGSLELTPGAAAGPNGVAEIAVVAGDSVLLSLTGANHLADASQLSVSFGHGATAKISPQDYHTTLRPVEGEPGAWQLRVRVPKSLPAGAHEMEVRIERAGLDDNTAHGRVRFAPEPSLGEKGEKPRHALAAAAAGLALDVADDRIVIRVVPSIERISSSGSGANGGAALTIWGSGFSGDAVENAVLLTGSAGTAPCEVSAADNHRMVCRVGAASADGAVPPLAPAPDSSSPPLIRLRPLNISRARTCLHELPGADVDIDNLRACSGGGAEDETEELIILRHELEWPVAHPLSIDDSAFRHDSFVATTFAEMRVPVAATYSFRLVCDSNGRSRLCDGSLRLPGDGGASSGDGVVELSDTSARPLALLPGVAYGLTLRFAHIEHGESLRLAVNVSRKASEVVADGRAQPPKTTVLRAVPASWLSNLPALAEDDAGVGNAGGVSVAVRGVTAVCRSPDGCGFDLSHRRTPAVASCVVLGASGDSAAAPPAFDSAALELGRAADGNRSVSLSAGSVVVCTGARLHQPAHLHRPPGAEVAGGLHDVPRVYDPPRLFLGETELCHGSPAPSGGPPGGASPLSFSSSSFSCTIPQSLHDTLTPARAAARALSAGTGAAAWSELQLPQQLRLWTSGGGWATMARPMHALAAVPPHAAEHPSPGSTPLELLPSSRRHLLQGEVLWSQVRAAGGLCASSNGDCVLPAGQAWLLDASMDVRSLTVEGTLRWDASKDGLTLSSGFVVAQVSSPGLGGVWLGRKLEPVGECGRGALLPLPRLQRSSCVLGGGGSRQPLGTKPRLTRLRRRAGKRRHRDWDGGRADGEDRDCLHQGQRRGARLRGRARLRRVRCGGRRAARGRARARPRAHVEPALGQRPRRRQRTAP